MFTNPFSVCPGKKILCSLPLKEIENSISFPIFCNKRSCSLFAVTNLTRLRNNPKLKNVISSENSKQEKKNSTKNCVHMLN